MANRANKASNVILIGFMGTGKTSVGRRVARSLEFDFVDTDEQIVKAEQREISDIFEEDGEAAFRKIETRVLSECCQQSKQVISTGGGIVVCPENHAILKSGGHVIWLRSSAETIYDRVKRSNDRPLLDTENPQKTIRDLLKTREQWYQECKDLTITTDDLSLEETVYGVVETVRFWQI